MISIDKKRQLAEELLSHLDRMQGNDFGKMVMDSKKPAIGVEVIKPDDDMDAKVDDAIGDKPKSPGMDDSKPGIPDMDGDDGAPGDDKELSDDELAEMLKKYLGEGA